MKITKSQLKKLIKEELETALDEGWMDWLKRWVSGGTGGSGSKLLDDAIGANEKIGNFEAFKDMFNTRYAEDTRLSIEKIISVAKKIDSADIPGKTLGFRLALDKLWHGKPEAMIYLLNKTYL